MRDWVVLALALAYLALLFLIAWAGDRRARPPRRAPAVYALSIGVYCTSWTLYGAVGVAAEGGLDYLAIYVGPILVMGLGWPLIARMVRIARAENVVSISDFISARYGKSRGVAVLVTVAAAVGLLPYFALQLKAITISFEALASDAAEGAMSSLPGGTTLIVAAAMAAFAVLFGVRSVNANEPHRGLMLAVATESVVKLAAALVVGGAVAFFAFDAPGGIAAAVRADPELGRLLAFDWRDPVWWATCALAALAFLCLPRQFHVAVVENTHVDDVRTAAWAFPLYLVAINLFVLPLAIVGLTLFPDGGVQPDTFMVAVPRELGWTLLAFVAFLGGLSAATGMIIVATLALGTMVSNDVILPLLARHRGLRARWEANPGPALIAARRVAVVGIMALAYLCYQVLGSAYPLAAIGLISFAAVAQFAPALIGGMFWRRATAVGAMAGIGAGFLGWVWTVAVPAFVTAGWLPAGVVADGPFGVAALNPLALGGLALDPMLHGLLWSLGPNLALFLGVSLATEPTAAERRQAERFVGLAAESPGRDAGPRAASLADLHELAARYVGRERADATFRALIAARAGDDETLMPARSDAEAVQATERLLAGAIGSASARVVVASLLSDRRFSRSDARELIDEASRAILGQHELMRDALQNIRQGLCAFDADFRVTLWNPRFLELCDLPPDMVRVGSSLEEIVRYNEARGEYGQGQFDSLLARRSAPERRHRPDVYERRRPDGTVLEISTTPLPSGGFVAVYTDVTERYRAAAALREANEALEARVGERTLALSAAKAEAERANLGKTRFLAAAGHDLMQPLQAARLFLSALSERNADPAVGQIDASLDSVEHLLGELVEVSKLDSGLTTPSLADFRLADVLGPLAAESAALARARGLGFRAVPCSASVRSDPALLRRILQNFLANALRYTGTGRVLLGCRRCGGEIAIEVWDTGPGIPEPKLKDIFLEFHRLEQGKSRGEGLGLGLSIVERLAGLMGHRVEVRSRLGHGSCFLVRVPLAAAPVAALVPARRAQRRFDGALVVFVENEAAIAGAMRELLAGWSCAVVAAPTAEAALGELGERRPDVLLSDYHLDGGRTGLEALARLHAALGPDLPAALITADRDPALKAAVDAAGYRLLHKPVRPGALRALLAQMLAERAGRAAE
jgi:Na+/proline symporter/signal transduction histidine kinase/CheY-like chemotaxis protein